MATPNQDLKHTPQRCSDPDDPQRCHGACNTGQCPFKAVPGTKLCPVHTVSGVQHNLDQKKANDLYSFKNALARNRVNQFRNHPDFRNLEVEIAVVRLTLEEILNQCNASFDFLSYAPQITILVERIERLLKSNVRIGQLTGELMTLDQVAEIAQQLILAITERVNDPELIRDIATEFNKVFEKLSQN